MIRLTERAAVALKGVVATNRTPSDQGVKLVPSNAGGLGMVIERPAEGDDVVDAGNRPLLIVDASLTERLDGMVLDVAREETEGEQKGAEPRFVLRAGDNVSS